MSRKRDKEECLQAESGRRLLRYFSACAVLAPVLVLPAAAMVTLKVHFAGLEVLPGEPVVTVEAPDGGTSTAVDVDGDGWIVVRAEGRAGEQYRVIAALGGASVTRTVTLLESGEITLTWFLPGDQFEITAGGRLQSDDEIIVTARRYEEELQAIPLSVTAFTAEAIESRSLSDLRDVGDFAINVDFSLSNGLGGATSEATVYIRGIGQLDTALFADPGVGIYVDGVYLARAGGSVLDLLEVERVEVLRGPQGTLFGKNTTGGAISLVTRKPGPEKRLEIKLTGGDLDRFDGRLTSDFQLSETLFASLAAAATNRDGFSTSLATGERSGDDNRNSIRSALRWLASASTLLDLSADFTRERETAGLESLLAVTSTPLIDFYNRAIAGAGQIPAGAAFITGDPSRSYSTAESRNDGDVAGTTLTASWTSSDLELTSISAYREIEYDVANDGDGTPRSIAERSFLQHQDQLSQEVHLKGLAFDDRLRWLLGGLFFTESSDEDSLLLILGDLFAALEAAPGPVYAPPGVPNRLCSPGPPPAGVACFGGAGNPLNLAFFTADGDFERIAIKNRTWALFGEGTFSLGERWSASLGLRYSSEAKEFRFFRQPGSGAPPTRLFNRDDWGSFSPRLSLSWHASENALVYLSATQGFKSGGFNGRPQMRGALVPFDPETLLAYELGWKIDLSDHLRLNGAAFFSDYEDIQFSASLNVGGTPVFVIQNAGSAEVMGFELELASSPTRALDLLAGVGYIDTEYTDLRSPWPGAAPLDGVFPKTPKWTFTISPEFTYPLKSGEFLTLRADYSYRSEIFNDVQNSPLIRQRSYQLLNARVAWSSQSDAWEIALFGTNLGRQRYLEHGFYSAAYGTAVGIAGRPREWGLSFRWRLNRGAAS